MTNTYGFWQAALKGNAPVAVVDDPQCGFWRLKRNGGWLPVAVWPKGNGLDGPAALGFKIGREVVGSMVGTEQWPRYCSNPITEDVYRGVCERGENWPDSDPTVSAMLEKPRATRSPGIPNLAADEELEQAVGKKPADPTTEFAEQITAALAGVPSYKKIEADETSVRAASLRNMLLGLAGDADKARELEKAPHLKASRDVDAKWQPLIKQAREGAQTVRSAMELWENDKRIAAKEASDRAEKEQRQRDAEHATRDISEPMPEPVKPSSNLPAPAAQVKPTYGRASAVQTFQFITAIDSAKVFEHFKAHPDVLALLTKLAQAALNAGIEVDGVTHETRTRIK